MIDMDPLQRFGEYAAEFEKTYADDNWTRLEPYFDQDASYIVTGSSYDCEIRGRDAIFAGIKKALDGFDRQFDQREIIPGGDPVVDGNRIVFSAIVRYSKLNLETLSFSLSETAEFDESGRIIRLQDDYPSGQDDMIRWLEEHRLEFDPTYE